MLALALAVLAFTGLVAVPIAYLASPASATSLGNVLILSSSVTGGTASAEAAAVTADGYTPVVDTGTTWDSLTQSQFSSFSAVILGDPTCSTSASTSVGAAISDVSTWSPAITGNVVVAGASPVAAASGANPQGASTVTKDAVAYALASGSGKTGLYVSLSCYYAAAASGTSVPVLGGLGTFTVGGSIASTDSGTVNQPVEDGIPAFQGLTNAGLLGWSASVQETFGSWPSNYQVLALDHSASPSDFSGPGGLTGQPYILVNNAGTPPSFSGAVQGDIPTPATYGEADAAAPGITSGIATVGSGINVATGDFTESATDASAATYGPDLTIKRTYDANLAQSESVTRKPSAFGYGWSSNVGASLTFDSGTPNDIYTVSSGFNGPSGETIDAQGNVYVADTANNKVKELAASTHTQWGIAMTAGSVYTIAGTGTAGASGDSGVATSAQLSSPDGLAVDAAGNLYVADTGNSRIQEIASSSGTQWGQTMTANDIYTVVGTGTSGCTLDPIGTGKTAASNQIDMPEAVTVDSAGNLYLSDTGNNRVLEVTKGTDTQWGISMTAGDLYLIEGSGGCSSGHAGDGGAATSARLLAPQGIAIDGSGDLITADTGNHRIQEVASATATRWGINMTANDVYTVAGSASGSSGSSGDGGASTSALLYYPVGVAFDGAGDLAITDSGNHRLQEVAAVTRTQFGTAVTANDMYTLAGTAGSSGYSGDGGVAISAQLANPNGIAIDSSGNFYVLDAGTNSLREIEATAPSNFPLSPTSSGITVNQGNGAEINFIAPVSGTCPSPYVGSGTAGTYCAPPYVTATLSYSASNSQYTFITHPYTAYTFSSTGQLVAQAQPGGASENYTYSTPAPGSGSCPSSASSCDTVTSASGRALVLGLNSTGLVTSVTDPLGNRWTYAYTGSNLTSVTDPLSRVTSYTYDTTNTNPLFDHSLLSITTPDGQSGGSHAGAKLQNTYDTSGRITAQSDPDGNSTTLYYGYMNAATGNGVTITEDPDGNYSDYTFATGILDAKQIGIESSAAPSFTYYTPSTTTLLDSSVLDPDGGLTSYTYNGSGDALTRTNQLGEVTTESYNSFDEPTCSTAPLAASSCSSLSPPVAVAPGGAISPPTTAPPAHASYALYDTSGDPLWAASGVYQPGATTASYVRTAYNLFLGNSVTLGGIVESCAATPPSTNLPCATINPNAVVTQLSYDASGDVSLSSTPDGNPSGELSTTTYSYDADGNQTSTTSPMGNLSGANAANFTTTTTYDADREQMVITLAGGSGSTVQSSTSAKYYDADGNVIASTGPTGNPYSTGNPTGCNPATSPTACADTTYSSFNADDESTLAVNSQGNPALTCYDGDGNVAQTVPPSGVIANSLTGSSCPTSYPSGYGSTLATSATTNTYNAQGKVIASTAPPATGSSGAVTTTDTYDPAGNLIEEIAPPAATSGGTNEVTTSTYDLADEVTTQTTGFGTTTPSTTSDCYDPDGDKTATVPGTGNTSGVPSCGASSPWTTTSPYQTSTAFDSVGETVSSTSPPPAGQTATATTTYTYDAVGNKLSVTDPSSDVTSYTYSPLNKQTSEVTSSGGTSTATTEYYDAGGQEIAETSPGGGDPPSCDPVTTGSCPYTTYYTVNNAGQVLTSTNPDGGATTNYYNSSGNLVATTGPGGSPGTCNPTTSSTPCADTKAYTYNTLGQLTCTFEPNPSNNTCASPGSGAGVDTYTYNSNGLRATMSDGTGTTSYTYDSSGRLTSVSNGAGATDTYSYAQNSDVTCMSYPNASGNTCSSTGASPHTGIVNYTYNSSNQLSGMTDWAGNSFSYSYNATGQETNLSVNSGAVGVATTYDWAGNVESLDTTASGSTTLLNLSDTRNPNGTIATDSAQVGSTSMATDGYSYNGRNQVSSGPIVGTTGSSAYSYVADGGVNADTTSFASAAYDAADRLCWTSTTSSTNSCSTPPGGATTYTSNTDGERTSMTPSTGNPASYGWDTPTGTLTCVNTNGSTCSTSSPTGSTTINTYNGDNLRATSTIGSTTTNYTWNIASSTPQDISNGSSDFIYAPGSSVPTEQISASGSSPSADLLLTDANESVRGLVQLTSGANQDELVNYTDYDPYGNPITQSGGNTEAGGLTATQTGLNSKYVSTTPFGFGGGYTDPTGLVYFVNRYYDPATCQFMSVDPAVTETQQSFVYAGDNPINANDPTGNAPNYAADAYLESIAASKDAQKAYIEGSIASADNYAAILEGVVAGQDGTNAYLESLGVCQKFCVTA